MVTPAGGDARVKVQIEADADAAAAEVDAALSAALAGAINSPEVKAAFAAFSKSLADSIEQAGKGGGKNGAWDPIVKQAENAAEQVGKAWEKTAKSAAEANKAAGSSKQGEANLRTLNSVIEELASSMKSLQGDSKAALTTIQEMGKSARVAAEVAAREQRNASQEAQQSERLQITQIQSRTALALQASRARMEILRQVMRQAIIVERAIGQAVVAGVRAAVTAFRTLGRVAQTVFSGIASAIRRVFSRSGGGDELSRGLRRQTQDMNREMRAQEQTLQRSGTQRSSIWRRMFSRQNADVRAGLTEQTGLFRRAASEQTAALQQVQQAQQRGVLGLLSGRSALSGALGIGGLLAGGRGLRNLVGGGIGRLLDTEDATVQLQRMGLQLEQVNTLLAAVDTTFQGTPFANPDGFNVSAQLYASGRALDEIPTILGTVADFAAHGNVDLLEMAEVFTRIASQGKVTGEELNRLSDRNIPITQLAEAAGVTVEKFREMVSAGEVTADVFFEAAAGIEMFSGAAQAAGDTTRGAWSNTMTALKRGFEQFFKPFFGENGTVVMGLKSVQEFIKGNIIPVMRTMGEVIANNLPTIMKVGKALLALGALKGIAEVLRLVGIGLRTLLLGSKLEGGGRSFGGPLILFFTTMAVIVPKVIDASDKLREALSGLRETLGELFTALGGLATAVGGAFNRLFSAATGHESVMKSIGDAISRVITIISGGIGVVTEWVDLIAAAFGGQTTGSNGGGSTGLRAQGMLSSNNPYALLAGNQTEAQVWEALAGGNFADSILLPVSELPEEAQKIFAENFADVEWVSPQDAAMIWEQFSPDAQQLADGMTPDPTVAAKAKNEILKRLSDIFGLDDEQFWTSMSEGGNRLLNILDKTWLGPIIRFFRAAPDTIRRVAGNISSAVTNAISAVSGAITRFLDLTGLRGVAGFATDLWGAIFGGGDETTMGAFGSSRGLSVIEGQAESMGTRVLNVLEDTFLGPVVRFFRGPVADIVEKYVIPAVGDVITFFRQDFLPLAGNVLGRVRDFFTGIGSALRSAWDTISPIVKPLTDGLKEVFSSLESAKSVLIGGGIGAVLGGLTGGIPGILLGGLAGAGIGTLVSEPVRNGIVESLGNIGSLVTDKLEEAWASITGWFSDTFTFEQFVEWGKAALGLVFEVGRIIGSIATDPYVVGAFVVAAAGLAGAILLFVAALLAGFATAFAENVMQLGSIIGGFISDGWESAMDGLGLDGSGFVSVVSDVLGSSVVGLGIGVAAAGLGAKILTAIGSGMTSLAAPAAAGTKRGVIGTAGSAIVTTLTNSMRATVSGLGGLSGMIFGRVPTKGVGIGGEGSIFRNRGQAIGASLMAGVAIGVAGYQAGQSGSRGGIIMSILAGGAVGAGIGTSIAPGIGTAIGAALGIAAAGVGAFFGNAKRQAEEAAAATREFADAILQSGAAGAVSVVADNFRELDDEARGALQNIGFDVGEFVDNVTRRGQNAGSVVGDLITGIVGQGDLPAATDNLQGFYDVFARLVEQGENLDIDQLRVDTLLDGGAEDWNTFIAVLESAGVSFEDLGEIMSFVEENAGGLEGALDLNVDTAAVTGMGEALMSVAEASDAILESLQGGGTSTELNQILNQSGLGTEDRLQAINDALAVTQDAVETTRDALADLVSGAILGEDPEALARQFQLALPDIGSQLDRLTERDESGGFVIPVTLQELNREEILSGLRTDVESALVAGIQNGSITSTTDLQNAFNDLQVNIDELGLSPEAKALIEEELANIQIRLEDIDPASFDALAEAIANNDTLTAAAILAGTGIGEAMGTAAVTAYQRIQAQPQNFSFNQASLQEDTRFGAARTGAAEGSNPLQGVVDGFAGNVDLSAARTIGSNLADEVSGGIGDNAEVIKTSASKSVSDGATAAATAAILFIKPGLDTMSALAAGIVAAAGSIGSAVGNALAAGAGVARASSFVFFAIGANVANAMASGIASQARAVANAAALVAAVAAQAARAALVIRSPSRVFMDIGKQVGLGFAEGIKESEATFVGAIEGAINKAMDAANEALGKRLASAKAGQAIWEALTPAGMPGAPSTIDLNRMLNDLRIGQGSGFRQEAIAGAFSRTEAQATTHQAAIALNRTVGEMLNAFNQTKRSVHDVWKAVADGQALTREQWEWRNSSWLSLNSTNIAGAANQRAIADALENVRSWGQALVESGGTIQSATQKMEQYVTSIRNNAIAAGFSAAAVDGIIKTVGMSTAQLRAMRDEMTSLNASSTAGIENIQQITTQLQGIREYGSALLESGATADAVAAQMRGLRNQFLQQATAFGFNGSQLAALVEQAGLSDSALANFIKQMREFEQGAKEAAKAAGELEPGDSMRRPAVENLNLYLPYGDPESAGLAVANRLALERL